MQLSISTTPAGVFEPGTIVARPHSLVTGERLQVTAGPATTSARWYATRQEAFQAAHAGSLGAEAGALLVARGSRGFAIQPALVNGAAWHLEGLQVGRRPVFGRGAAVPALVAIIDGAAILVPAS